jgi:hypothetical protein
MFTNNVNYLFLVTNALEFIYEITKVYIFKEYLKMN